MAENQILPFAQGQGANVLSQADYAGDSMRLQGHQPGVARSALENKALLQCSAMAAGLAQFIADGQADDVTDAKTPAEIAAMLADATAEVVRNTIPVTQLNAQNGYVKLPAEPGKNGIIIQWGLGSNPYGVFNITLPITFPNNAYNVVATFASNEASNPMVLSLTDVQTTHFSLFGKSTSGDYMSPRTVFFWVAIGD